MKENIDQNCSTFTHTDAENTDFHIQRGFPVFHDARKGLVSAQELFFIYEQHCSAYKSL